MNKKILFIAVVVIAVVTLATPTFASPTKGNKVEVTLIFVERTSRIVIDEWYSNDVRHQLLEVTWNVELIITGGPTLEGTAFAERKILQVPQKDGAKMIIVDYYEFWFETEGGGFEGNGVVVLDGFVAGTWERGRAHVLLEGIDAFEGQTLNVGSHWVPPQPLITWYGYLLKP